MAFMQKFLQTKSVTKRGNKYLEEALYKRLFKEGSSVVSVRQQLNQFLKSKKRVYKWEVCHSLKIPSPPRPLLPRPQDQSLCFIQSFKPNLESGAFARPLLPMEWEISVKYESPQRCIIGNCAYDKKRKSMHVNVDCHGKLELVEAEINLRGTWKPGHVCASLHKY